MAEEITAVCDALGREGVRSLRWSGLNLAVRSHGSYLVTLALSRTNRDLVQEIADASEESSKATWRATW